MDVPDTSWRHSEREDRHSGSLLRTPPLSHQELLSNTTFSQALSTVKCGNTSTMEVFVVVNAHFEQNRVAYLIKFLPIEGVRGIRCRQQQRL